MSSALTAAAADFTAAGSAISTYHSVVVGIRTQVDDLRSQWDKLNTNLQGEQFDYSRAERFGEANDMTPEQITTYKSGIQADESKTRNSMNALSEQYQALVTKSNQAAEACSSSLSSSITGTQYNGSAPQSVGLMQALGIDALGLIHKDDGAKAAQQAADLTK